MDIKCRFAYFSPNHSSEIVTNMLEKEKEREITCWLCKQTLVGIHVPSSSSPSCNIFFDDAGCYNRGVATKLNTQPTLYIWFIQHLVLSSTRNVLEVKYSHAKGKIFHFLWLTFNQVRLFKMWPRLLSCIPSFVKLISF